MDHYSSSFLALLPGMAYMLMYVIERKGKMWLITDQNCVHDLLMSLILLVEKNDHAVPLCNLQQFGYFLHDLKALAQG